MLWSINIIWRIKNTKLWEWIADNVYFDVVSDVIYSIVVARKMILMSFPNKTLSEGNSRMNHRTIQRLIASTAWQLGKISIEQIYDFLIHIWAGKSSNSASETGSDSGFLRFIIYFWKFSTWRAIAAIEWTSRDPNMSPGWCGSSWTRRGNISRFECSLMRDYLFERLICFPWNFRRRFRIPLKLFRRLFQDLPNVDTNFQQELGASGRIGATNWQFF